MTILLKIEHSQNHLLKLSDNCKSICKGHQKEEANFYRKFCKYINKFKLLFDRIHLTYLKHFVIFTDIP